VSRDLECDGCKSYRRGARASAEMVTSLTIELAKRESEITKQANEHASELAKRADEIAYLRSETERLDWLLRSAMEEIGLLRSVKG
jgi:ubiquinone biosynthesis protein UbiJ